MSNSNIVSQENVVMPTVTVEDTMQELAGILADFNVSVKDEPLSSSYYTGRFITLLNKDRENLNDTQRWAVHGIVAMIEKCSSLENQLKELRVDGSFSPQEFMDQIDFEDRSDLSLPALRSQKLRIEEELQAVVDNAEHDQVLADKSDAEIVSFTNKLKRLIAAREWYAFIEETQGFVSHEFLLEYKQYLTAAVEDAELLAV